MAGAFAAAGATRTAWQGVQRSCSADVFLLSCGCCMQEHKEDIWDGSNVLAVMAGSASEDLRYLKSVSLHLWLFGYEVTGTCCPAS